CQHTYGIPYSF
nr:immunoglobulin light chain junction region [Macaca mulatta]